MKIFQYFSATITHSNLGCFSSQGSSPVKEILRHPNIAIHHVKDFPSEIKGFSSLIFITFSIKLDIRSFFNALQKIAHLQHIPDSIEENYAHQIIQLCIKLQGSQ